MTNKIKTLAVLAVAACFATCVWAQQSDKKEMPAQQKQKQPAGPRPRTSPHETIGQVIDGNRVTIVYGRPYSARGGKGEPREIWGKLVPYGQRWRIGSDEATLLITQQPIEMDGKTIPAGAHTLFMFLDDSGNAKLAVNNQVGQWGIPARNQADKEVYDEANDVARIDLKKEPLDNAVEEFTMAIERNPSGGGVIKMMWEKTQYSVAFTVKK
jgi:uncharacterized protein YdeI (BOF family)